MNQHHHSPGQAWSLLLVSLLFAACALPAKATRLVILHTNDVHDHVRPGYNGAGGLPYVSGYIRQVRAVEPAVLVVDAGDIAEKGDMVAHRTNSLLTYEAMRRMGYDAVAIGNHDFDPGGPAGIGRFEQALGQPMLCLNIIKRDGTPEFTPSRIVTVGGLKVGLIGMIVPRHAEAGGLDFASSGRALAREAHRLRPQVDLLVAVCHEGVPQCADWSRAAPGVQVFVSGHSHVPLAHPFVVPETGALIVQAGSYARWVGRLELDVDPKSRTITRHSGRLVSMQAGETPIDADMAAWVKRREAELCPEAAEVVAQNDSPVSMRLTGWLAADALRRAAGSDLGFCHVGNIIRSPLPSGPVDVNALFVAGGQRGDKTVLVALTGAQIKAYVTLLGGGEKYNQTTWSGMRVMHGADGTKDPLTTSLDDNRKYSVIMPELEWSSRFVKMSDLARKRTPGSPLAGPLPEPRPSSVEMTLALRTRALELTHSARSLGEEARALADAGTDVPDDPLWWR